jgi:Flp pilus assembly protein TadG
MLRFNFTNLRREEGQVIVLFAIFSIVLIGVLALAVDVGYLYSQRREAQAAVDAAAMAGGVAMLAGESDSVIQDTADAYLVVNGIDLGAAASSVSIEGDQNDGVVTVDVTLQVERFFLGAIYTGAWEVGAHAVAEITDDRNGEYALMALDPEGMYVNGNIEVRVENGSAMSNGDVANSGGSSIFVTGGTIDAVGEVEGNSNWYAPEGMFGNRPEAPDPLAGAVPPNPATLPVIEQDDVPDCKNNCTLQPGLYRDISIASIAKTATLQPGVYYFDNTSIDLKNNGLLQGNNVMLYFTGNSVFYPKNGAVDLRAPATSPYTGGLDGMAVWIANCTEFNSQGNNEFYIEGVFYAPCSRVWLHGNPYGDTIRGQVIVGSLDVRGNSEMTVRYVNHVHTPRFELWLVE